jgi:hypothetical protein
MKRYLLPIILLSLACGGTAAVTEVNVRVTGVPQFVCPSSTPVPTATQAATAVQPNLNYPASGWVVTYQQVCRLVWNGKAYVQQCSLVPNGGYYSTPAYSVPGATSTPRPTHTPYPTPTPYIVTENYAMGADVHVGDRSTVALRLRVERPQVVPVDATRQVVMWDVRIKNIGALPYNTLPGAQVFVSEVGGATGNWYTSSEAGLAAGITLDPAVLDIAELAPNQSITLTLTAFTPIGEVGAIAWLLDPYSGGAGGGVVGGNTAVWRSETDPNGCEGNVGELFELPTPKSPAATATASVTPWIPPYAGATRAP